jgi:hypothetical protein
MKAPSKQRFMAFMQILGVQSIVCAAVLLAVLLFRLAGGNAFGELRKGFREAMQENTWLSAVVSLLDGDVSE